MKNILFYITICIILMISFNTVIAQDNKLIVYTSVFLDDQKTEDVKILLKSGDVLINTFLANNERKIELELEYQNNYNLYFEKDGYITKSVNIDTQLPEGSQTTESEALDFELELYKFYDQVDLSVFDDPVAKISYYNEISSFDYNYEYSMAIKDQIEKVRKELYNRRRDFLKEEKTKRKNLAIRSVKEKESNKEQFENKKLTKSIKPRENQTILNVKAKQYYVSCEVATEAEKTIKKELVKLVQIDAEEKLKLKEQEKRRLTELTKAKLKQEETKELKIKKEITKVRDITTNEEPIKVDNIHFEFNKYTLSKESLSELDKLVEYLKENNSLKLEISGHTCNIGSEEINKIFSRERAKFVYNYLPGDFRASLKLQRILVILPVFLMQQKLLIMTKKR